MRSKESSIEYPKEIKNNNYIFGNIDGEEIMIPYDDTKKIKQLFKKKGKWYVGYEK